MSDTIVAPVRRNMEETAPLLAGWLAQRIEGASDLSVHDLDYPRGAGLSNETILFTARWRSGAEWHDKGFVLRLQPSSHRVYMELDFEAQFKILRTMEASGLGPAPKPVWFESDPSLFGVPFFIMERLTGRVAVTFPPYTTHGWVAEATSEQRQKIWRNGVTALAGLHRAPMESFSFLDKPQHGATGWEQEWNYWQKSYDWAKGGRTLPTCDRARDWLKAHMPERRASGLCWNDARLGNLMFDGDFEVLAIMDWEGASLGGSLQDLGFWLCLDKVVEAAGGVHPEGFGTREETIALWERVSGASAADIVWYEVFGGFKLACHVARGLTMNGAARPAFDFNDNGATRFLAEKLDLPPPESVL